MNGRHLKIKLDLYLIYFEFEFCFILSNGSDEDFQFFNQLEPDVGHLGYWA